MIIDEIKKSNIQAMRDKDTNLRAIYGVVINKHLQATINARTTGKAVDDAEMVRILQKTIKELMEEAENYAKVGNNNKVDEINAQRKVLEKFLPDLMGEEEIKKIILSLEDRSIPFVMKYFKQNHDGQCDMKIVQNVLKTM